jgi:hypothetical protein
VSKALDLILRTSRARCIREAQAGALAEGWGKQVQGRLQRTVAKELGEDSKANFPSQLQRQFVGGGDLGGCPGGVNARSTPLFGKLRRLGRQPA